MKNSSIFMVIAIFFMFAKTQAQTFTQIFDSVFTHISRTDATTGILYERVLPFGNLTHYNSLEGNPDTSNYSHFMRAYDELYRATFQPSITMIPKDTLKQLIENDTSRVQIGMLHFYFNTFDTIVFRNKLYFDNDSVLWEDPFNTNSLYKENVLFVASPLTQVLTTLNVRFTINSLFYFDNTREQFRNVSVDFDDGLGFRLVGLNEVVRVKYLQDGIKTIMFKVSLKNGDILSAYATIEVKTEESEGQRFSGPLYYDDFSGPTAIKAKINLSNPYDGGNFQKQNGEIRIYYANSDKILRKPLLIIDGFDPLDERKFDTNLVEGQPSLWKMFFYDSDCGQHLHLGLHLLDMGYDVVLLNLPDGGAYIEENALVCIEVLNQLNEMLSQNNSTEQIVVVGPSMGGQIARYALTFMEQHPNDANTNYGKHNTRLWISYDSPHQGANIAMGAQVLIEHFAKEEGDDDVSQIWRNKLCCNAAMQMLIHHRKDTLQQLHNAYYFQIRNLNTLTNGYPSNIRNIAIANGSLNNISIGIPYQISYEGLITFPGVYSYDIRTRNVVNFGTGTVFDYTHWILFVPIHKEVAFSNNFGKGSIDVAPGCLYDTYNQINAAVKKKSRNLSITVHNNQYHCFMPITSTLDISGNMNYCTDISSRDLVAEGLTPFDSYTGVMDSNMYHVTFNQQIVDYMLNEIETYITGPREIRLCAQWPYAIHLPEDSVAEVTWLSSANIRVEPTNNPYVVNIVPLSTGDGWISAEVSTLKHRKTLAHYPIHIANNDDLTPIVQETTIQGQSFVINDERYLTTDTFCIENGKTMTVTGTLHSSSGTRIIVRPGGRLVVDGGVLTSACEDGMWEGIYVEGDRTRSQTAANQGTVELKNGAVIENAHCGITTSSPDEQWLSTGGIILADSASFRNCRRAVAFLSYADTIGQNDIRANQSRFNKCSFSVDDDNHFSANGTSFYAHASLWDVNGVRFDGCTFTNTMTGRYANSGRAIYSEDAGFSVKTLCGAPDNMNIPCECPAAYATYSSVSGFSTAVETNTTGSQYGITLDEVRFSNNARAVAVNGNNHATVTRCEFNLQNMPGSVGITKGLVLNNCTGYLVEGNDFSGNLLADGIVVNNSGTDNNSIYRNSFSNLHYGANVQGGNGTMQKVSTGLVFSCNDFTNDNYDIYLNQNSTMRLNQGNAGLGVDNCFSGSRISSLYAEPLGYSYYYSTGVCHQPRSAHNFTLHSGAQANGCASTLCAGITPGTGPGLPIRSSEGEYAMLKNRYDSLLTVFEARGFADVLTDAEANPVVEDSRVASAKRMRAELASLGETLHRMAHAAVRGLKNDTVTDLVSLADWYAATPGLSSRYAEHELAPSAILAAAIADNLSTAEERDEYDNYSLFVSTRRANWPASTESDIEMLRRIAERNTGRSSEMAKGVLCFFFDECVEEETGANTSDTRSVRAVGEEAGNELSVYPNPSSDKLSVYSSRLAISSLQLFDAFGKLLLTRSVNDGEYELDLTAVPAGIYLLKAELEDGSIEVLKVVKK